MPTCSPLTSLRNGTASSDRAVTRRTSGHARAAVTIRLPTGRSAKPATVVANMIAVPPTYRRRRRTTIAEWTFYQQFSTYFIDSPDISAVNGANLTMDISPRGGDDLDPLNPKDFHWLNWNYPLTVHGKDLREPSQCVPATGTGFQVIRSDIDKTTGGAMPNYPLLGYVIVDGNGNPTMPTGNNVLACLSNCGKFKFPKEAGKIRLQLENRPQLLRLDDVLCR